MIWDLIEQSQFDKHFHKEDLTITTLLLDENIITQLKNQNPKLLQYITQHKQQFIKELIEYTVIMPKETDSYERGHKLPYISSELLAIDSDLIYQEFFKSDIPEEANPFWLQLIALLETEAAQNEILMGYFEKVINNLYNGNKPKTTKVVSHHLQKFVMLLHNGSIGDILKKCIILLNTPQGAVIEERQRILNEIIHRFVGTDEQVKQICSDVLTEVVNKFQAFSSGDQLIEKILKNEELHEIYWIEHSPAVNDFLVGLLKKSQQRIVNENDVSVRILTVPQLHLENITKYLKTQVENLSELISSDSYLTNQNRVLVRKSNKKIYPILTLVSLAIQENLFGFVSSKFVNSLWSLIILYPYNNIMQVSVIKIFLSILKSSATQIRNIFLDRYEEYLLELSKNNMQMFRPLVLTIWKQSKVHPVVTNDEAVLAAFNELIQQQIQPLLKYQINKNAIQHHHSNKKLIVDEEDKQVNPVQSFQNVSQQTDFVPHPQPVEDSEPQQQVVQPSVPKDSFDFFSGWETEKKTQKSKEPEKASLFDDFSNFF